MSYQVFARKYRPKTFNDVLGQDHVVQTLRNAIAQDRLAHAYLFVGPRGTGKTSTARILAKALNCPGGPSVDFDPDNEICLEIADGSSLDVLEIDGASNNGVEQVRDLRDNVRFAPTRGRFKIYYIDEVHMLSTAAFNALLKTLEEPPEHVKFIFATTEPNKILPTIISRCQRFDLRPITTEVIAKHLQYIATEEGVDLNDAGAWAIAKGADGGMRDAQSMLDQLVAFCGTSITEENVLNVFGFTSREIIANLAASLFKKDTTGALQILHDQAKTGKDLGQLLDELISCLRIILVSKVDSTASNEGIPQKEWDVLCKVSSDIPSDRLLHLIDIFAEAESRMKWASNKRLHLEIGLIKAIQSLSEIRISDVITALAGAHTIAPTELPEVKPTPTPELEEVKEAPTEPTASVEEVTPAPHKVEEVKAPEPEPQASQSTTPTEPETTAPTTDDTPVAVAEPVIESPVQPVEPEPAPVADPSDISFEDMIDAAPEFVPEPEPAPAPIKKEEVKSEPAVKEDSPAKAEAKVLDEKFYEDPLILEALALFKAKLVK